MDRTYLVKSTDYEGLDFYWSNADGWVDKPYATVFTEEEKDTLNLPIGGKWVANT